MTEVLLARMVSPRTCGSMAANSFCFSCQVFGYRLDDVIGPAHRLGEIGARPHARDGTLLFAKLAQIGGDAILYRIQACRDCVCNRDVMTGNGKNLGNAVAHEAGADDGYARLGHAQPAV